MRVAIGSDHAGFEMKEALKGYLGVLQHDVLDLGTHSTAPVDYPDYAEAVGIALRRGKAAIRSKSLIETIRKIAVSTRLLCDNGNATIASQSG